MINLRIVYVDHYLSKPIQNLDPIKCPLNDEPINLVPVLRIFGTLRTGEKCCAHVHGFFPYLTVERDAFANYSIDCLANELNKILNEVYPKKDETKQDTIKVYSIETIESKSFYGFKECTQQFLRIHFLNPKSVRLAFKLIKQGKLFNCKCNVYEAHITYIMQFFVNFKLSGMNFMNLDAYHERQSNDRRLFSKDKQYFISQEKQSICQVEIDVLPQNIIVANDENNKFINPGLVLIWQEEKQRLIESNKDMKDIFKSNLKDFGNRVYEKKSLEQNYLKQLKDYLNYKDNFKIFDQNFTNSSFDKDCQMNIIENYLNHSVSQSVLERIIESEKKLIDCNSSQIHSFSNQDKAKLNSKDIRSQEFAYLIKNFKNKDDSLQNILDNVKQYDENDSDESLSSDELDIEKETRFTNLMLQTQKSILDSKNSSRTYSQDKELFRFETNSSSNSKDKPLDSQNDAKHLSESSSQQQFSCNSSLDPDDFNLNNESCINSPKYESRESSSQLTNSQSSDEKSNGFQQQVKRTCEFNDQLRTGFLVSLNDEPLFSDDDDDDTFTNRSSPKTESQSTVISEKSISRPLSQLSDAEPKGQLDSQTDNKSIFSFYSLESVDFKTDFSQTSDSLPDQQPTENKRLENNYLNNEKLQASTSTPLNFNVSSKKTTDLIDKLRVRSSLGNKFLKLSNDSSKTQSSRTQSPISQSNKLNEIPSIRIDSPNVLNSFNQSVKSNFSTQSKHSESSFTMNEKIQHLSESSNDHSSPTSKLTHENQNLTILTMELFAATEHEMKSNPLQDSIKMIFYMIFNDYSNELLQNKSKKKYLIGIIIVKESNLTDLEQSTSSTAESTIGAFNLTTHLKRKPSTVNNLLYFQNKNNIKIDNVDNELNLIEKFIEILVKNDPDIVCGFEIETSSWGYLITRAEMLRIDISIAFSRLLTDFNFNFKKQTNPPEPSSEQPILAKQAILNRTQCEEDDEFDLSDQEIVEDEDQNQVARSEKPVNQMLNNNYLNRNKWETLEKFKQNRPDFGTIKTRSDLRDKVKDNDNLVQQYQTIFSLSYVSPCYMSLVGRIMLNIWRCVRKSELALNAYTFENVYYHLFKRRRPYYTCKQLTEWYYSNNNFLKQNVLNYYLIRINGNIEIIDRLGIVSATSELARVFGIQFSDVISKGSQFRVESLLYRSTIDSNQDQFDSNKSNIDELKLHKSKFNKSIREEINLSKTLKKSRKLSSSTENLKKQKFMLLSCNFDDRLTQNDPTIIPFIMEPKPGFYTNNIAVLDFQSLYPSIMIAYNLCYSTCLGKLDYITNNLEEFPLGFSRLKVSTNFIKENLDNINISPNGILFCNQNIRKGILSGILEEILETRLMVKKCLKMYKDEDEKEIVKLLDARQLGLKLLANVTYGYTAAGFSGRMPCIDLADAIISKGRETLINSINFINNSTEFGGEVIYGDTDSMFVEFKSITREEAFRRAERLCELITLANPNPIKLKLEKIYSECVLLSKKHYGGYAFDTPEQKKPRFESKGFEIVRRDTIGLVKKVMEKSLRILFETKSINEIKPYLESVFYKVINENGENLHEYIFAKEYRGILGYRPKTYIPSMEISNQLVEKYGEHCRPFIKERVPYVIGNSQINERLVKLVIHPLDYLNDSNLRINSAYYIDRVLIPPIQRVFGLLNLNIRHFYNELPKKVFYLNAIEKQNLTNVISSSNTNTLTNYFNFVKCLVCDRKLDQSNLVKSICADCLRNTQSSIINLFEELRLNEIRLTKSTSKCLDCTKMNCNRTQCKSIDCENLFKQNRLLNNYKLMRNSYDPTLNELAAQHCAKLEKLKK